MIEGDRKMASFFQSGINARDVERNEKRLSESVWRKERVEGDVEGKTKIHVEEQKNKKGRDGEWEQSALSLLRGVETKGEIRAKGREGGKKKKERKNKREASGKEQSD